MANSVRISAVSECAIKSRDILQDSRRANWNVCLIFPQVGAFSGISSGLILISSICLTCEALDVAKRMSTEPKSEKRICEPCSRVNTAAVRYCVPRISHDTALMLQILCFGTKRRIRCVCVFLLLLLFFFLFSRARGGGGGGGNLMTVARDSAWEIYRI